MMKYKHIQNSGITFLHRLSIYFKSFSIKIHLILNDDKSNHTHPWDFTSFLIIPYKEVIYVNISEKIRGAIPDQYIRDKVIKHKAFTKVTRKANVRHKVLLYTIFGFDIPALTIGKYSNKKELCSLCKEAGYCKSNKRT